MTISHLGAPSSNDPDAWGGYLSALADQLELANAQMLTSYDAMREALSVLDVPLMQTSDNSAAMGYPTSWTKELDQNLANANAMGTAAVSWLREAASGNRKLLLQGDRALIEQKPDDPFSIGLDPATHMLVMLALPGTVQGAEDDVATLGLAPVLIGLGIVAGAAVQIGFIYLAIRLVETIGNIALGIIDYWSTKKQYDCLSEHKPEECIKTQQGIIELQKTINQGRVKPSDDPAGNTARAIGETAKTLLWVGFGGALLYLGFKTIPPMLEEMDAKRKAAKAAA